MGSLLRDHIEYQPLTPFLSLEDSRIFCAWLPRSRSLYFLSFVPCPLPLAHCTPL